MTPSFGSINLLEHLTELRATFSFLGHWFIRKEQPDGKGASGKVWGKGLERPCPLLKSPHVPNPELSKPCPFGVLCSHNRLSHWPLTADSASSPSPLPGGQGVGLKVPTL